MYVPGTPMPLAVTPLTLAVPVVSAWKTVVPAFCTWTLLMFRPLMVLPWPSPETSSKAS